MTFYFILSFTIIIFTYPCLIEFLCFPEDILLFYALILQNQDMLYFNIYNVWLRINPTAFIRRSLSNDFLWRLVANVTFRKYISTIGLRHN